MTRAEIVAEARRWLWVKYRHEGRSRAGGVDCVGLLIVVAEAFGVPFVDQHHYTAWPDPQRRIFAEMDKFLELRSMDPRWEGTIGIFAQERLPCHAGFFSLQYGRPHVIHSRLSARRVVEEPFDDNPHNRTFRLLRRYGFPGLAD